ncbi:MAG: ribosome recycling factor [Chloroflexi bacterium]|nr:ribosome recycling factor [Chloroflexota bacterium]MDA1146378.1 ribosome recycling factor [Chloroflexota bacterium]MQC82250.1 ribosome recycling factor [Chloroflexota bacterium]MQC82691.1 ribosome recycling factor [Chloroflexota bacterium]
MIDEILLDAEERMDNAVEAFKQVLATVRTGRANTSLVEHLQVEHYGERMTLIQLASLGAPEAQLITIQPWDQSAVNPIMKAIQTSDLGITPQSDGKLIRLPIPPLTEDRRRDMVKQVNTKTEEARISVRNSRRHAMDELKKALRASEISEDEEHRAEAEIERLTQAHIERVEAAGKEKEQELLQV